MIKRFKRNKKGFSLVELIIVIAIMVALVAVMAPAYVKYVQRSHDAVVEAAAESVLQFVKAEMGDGSFTGVGKMKIGRDPLNEGLTSKNIIIKWIPNDDNINTMKYQPGDSLAEDQGYAEFISACGVDETKQIKSNLVYEIEIYSTQTVSGHPNLQAKMDVVDGNG